MSIRDNFSHTIRACKIAYITQSAAVNFAPLLFLTFGREFSITFTQISSLIAITFIIQLSVDLAAAGFVDRIGYRVSAVIAHILAGLGFVFLGVLPYTMNSPFAGIMTACFLYSCGSGLIEVLVSPIVESCPTENKAAAMGVLHSFYSWGTAIVILVSTIFFSVFGIGNWRVMAIIWSIVPFLNAILFVFVPIRHIGNEKGENRGFRNLLKNKMFFVVIMIMTAGGAAELAMSQWASAFAESALGVPKAAGDIAGAFMFAVAMGTGRILYSHLIKRIKLLKYMIFCAVLCVISYFMASLAPNSALALFGCALTGFAVGVFWPGTFSYAAEKFPGGGTAMFGMLAFAGDVGCTLGPAFVGTVGGFFGDDLKMGLLSAVIFPIILIIGVIICSRKR